MMMHAYNDDMNESVNLDNSNDTHVAFKYKLFS